MATKYKRYTVNTPPMLAEIIDKRVPECPYSSASAYFLGLAIFDCWSRREHRYTAKLMAQPPPIRDAAFERLATEFKQRKGATTPGWFDHFVQEVVESELSKAHEAEYPKKRAQQKRSRGRKS
ncbi:MAG: hypothetical protein QOE70_5305 [Chthoniobacter sp.]|nr:hypothetical protein [Chthoniobacter sp.]